MHVDMLAAVHHSTTELEAAAEGVPPNLILDRQAQNAERSETPGITLLSYGIRRQYETIAQAVPPPGEIRGNPHRGTRGSMNRGWSPGALKKGCAKAVVSQGRKGTR